MQETEIFLNIRTVDRLIMIFIMKTFDNFPCFKCQCFLWTAENTTKWDIFDLDVEEIRDLCKILNDLLPIIYL